MKKILFLIVVSIFISCTEDDNPSNDINQTISQLNQTVSSGNWIISYFLIQIVTKLQILVDLNLASTMKVLSLLKMEILFIVVLGQSLTATVMMIVMMM